MAQTIAEQIVSELKTAYDAHTGETSVAFQFGELKRRQHAQARRVVFVRSGGRLEPPKRSGGKWMRDGFEASSARFDKVEDVTAHIYDTDAANIELIHENLMVVISNTLGTAVQIAADYTWRTEQPEGAADLNWVHKIEQPMTWRLAIPDTPATLAAINAFTHACEFGFGEYNNDFSRDFKFAGGESAD